MSLFERRIIMAPIAGVTEPAYIAILKDCGCAFAYTGLLTSHGLIRANEKTRGLITPMPDGMDISAQIFGNVPEIMAEAARILEDMGSFRAIDINMGCPVPKVTKNSGGASLMTKPELAREVVASVVAAVKLPVTVKLRSGWDAASINFVEMAKICEGAGAAAIALHPRTKAQGYSGRADWSHIALLKESVAAPVIGSGDIVTPQDALRMFNETGCDSVMIGRACCGTPWLIKMTEEFIKTGALSPEPSTDERIEIALKHLAQHVKTIGEKRAVPEMRKFIPQYIKGMPGASNVRRLANYAGSEEEMKNILLGYRERLRSGAECEDGAEQP